MMNWKRLLSLLVISVMFFNLSSTAYATNYEKWKDKEEELLEEQDKAEQQGEELEEKKEEAEKTKKELAKELDSLISDMDKLKKKIDAKEEEISAKEEELIDARLEENDQYESMKKRIKYMYENGNVQLIEILFESENIGDFLNKAEYISTISNYDRDMLKVFQKVTEDVKAQEKLLKEEYADMEEMQNQLIGKQDSIENLMKTKAKEIEGLESELKENAEKLEELKDAVADAKRKQQEALNTGGTAGESYVSGNGYFTHPCPGYSRISSHFGYRKQPLPGASTNHKGMDFAAPTGTPIYAVADGTVTTAAYSGNAGNMIVINHGKGIASIYMHCHAMYVSPGQKVTKGQNIAIVGNTGNSTGPHLHFQVNVNGVPTNPLNYL